MTESGRWRWAGPDHPFRESLKAIGLLLVLRAAVAGLLASNLAVAAADPDLRSGLVTAGLLCGGALVLMAVAVAWASRRRLGDATRWLLWFDLALGVSLLAVHPLLAPSPTGGLVSSAAPLGLLLACAAWSWTARHGWRVGVTVATGGIAAHAVVVQLSTPAGPVGELAAELAVVHLWTILGITAVALAPVLRGRHEPIDVVRRQLHDDVVQPLVAAQAMIGEDDRAARVNVHRAMTALREVLRPGEASRPEESLAVALHRVTDEVAVTHGSRAPLVTLDVGEHPALTSDVLGAVTGAVREALVNVARHARSSAPVRVRAGGTAVSGLRVSVVDRGGGPSEGALDEGFGLRVSIRERLADVGGHAEVAVLDDGVRVVLHVPAATGHALTVGPGEVVVDLDAAHPLASTGSD